MREMTVEGVTAVGVVAVAMAEVGWVAVLVRCKKN
jgi:hypothetical protein